jgi:hypothetical protein
MQSANIFIRPQAVHQPDKATAAMETMPRRCCSPFEGALRVEALGARPISLMPNLGNRKSHYRNTDDEGILGRDPMR